MNQFMLKYKTGIEWLSYILFAVTLFSLAFPWSLTQPLIVAWVVSWLLEFRWLKRPTWHNSLIPQLLLVALLIFEALSLLWNDNTSAILHEVNIHHPILYVLILSLWGVNDKYDADILRVSLIMGCLLSAVFYIGFNYHVTNNQIEEFLRPNTSWNIFDLGEGPVKWIKHRQHYSIVLLMAVAFCPSLYRVIRQRIGWSNIAATSITLIVAVLLITIIFSTSSRIALLLLPIIILIMFFHYGSRYVSKRTIAITTTLVIVIGIAILATHPRMKRLYNDMANIEQGKTENLDYPQDPRWHIWQTVIDNRDSYGLLGIGIGNDIPFLVEKYTEEGFGHEAYQGYSAHNQFMHKWITLGPIAAILLLLAFGLMPFMPRRGYRYTATVTSLVFVASMMTDIPLEFIGALYILYCALILIETEVRSQAS